MEKETRKGPLVALDFETYYEKKTYSVAGQNGLTVRQYVTDPRFDAYLVSFAVEDTVAEEFGIDIEGWETSEFDAPDKTHHCLYATAMHPDEAKWEQFAGATFVIHNAGFDTEVLNQLIRTGQVPRLDYTAVDTADLVAYLGVKRNLKTAMKYLYGVEISKKVRSDMDGKHVTDLSEKERDELYRYGTDDSIHCHMIWTGYEMKWPHVERMMSRLNLESNARGIDIDRASVEAGLEHLKKIRADGEAKLPWVNDPDPENRYPAASTDALAKWLGTHGYRIPTSFNKRGNEFLDWMKTLDKERDAELFGILEGRMQVTGTNSHIARLETMLAQMDEDDRLHPGFVYFGAHTGRFTAGVSLENDFINNKDESAKNVNLLNMTKKPVYGVDMRAMYIAGPGRKLVIADYSQVEARALLWLADDVEMCEALSDPKANLYQLTAYKMGWCGKDDDIKHNDAQKYQLAKQCVLGLGYSMATFKFLLSLEAAGIPVPTIPRDEWTDDDRQGIRFVIEKQAFLSFNNPSDEHRIGQLMWVRRIVEQWRDANWRIAGRKNPDTGFREGGFWREQQQTLIQAAYAKAPRFWVVLPNGRIKTYHEPVVCTKSEITGGRGSTYYMARTIQGGRASTFSGGTLTENIVQAFCRDILVNSIVEIAEKHTNWKYLFNVYDEVVFSVPEDEAEFALKEIGDIMCHGDNIRDWTKGLPLGIEGCISDHYTK